MKYNNRRNKYDWKRKKNDQSISFQCTVILDILDFTQLNRWRSNIVLVQAHIYSLIGPQGSSRTRMGRVRREIACVSCTDVALHEIPFPSPLFFFINFSCFHIPVVWFTIMLCSCSISWALSSATQLLPRSSDNRSCPSDFRQAWCAIPDGDPSEQYGKAARAGSQ